MTLLPIVLKKPTYGLRPDHVSKGVTPFRDFVAHLFLKKVAVLISSAHNESGKFACNFIHLVISTSVRLAPSATPFCYGVCSTVNCREIPSSSRKFLKL